MRRIICLSLSLAALTPTPALAAVPGDAELSSGIAFPSASDSLRYNASALPLNPSSSLEGILGLPIANQEKLSGIGSAVGRTGDLGVGAGVEYWNPGVVYRLGAGYRFAGHTNDYSIGGAFETYHQTQDPVTGAPVDRQSTELTVSGTVRHDNLRFSLVAQSADSTFDIITGGIGFQQGVFYAEFDTEWVRNQFNDLYFPLGAGIAVDQVHLVARYYFSYNVNSADQRTVSNGEFSTALGYDLSRDVMLEAVYKYDPDTYDLGVKYRF